MKRAYLQTVQNYLSYFPCVAVLGARQCGKTTLMRMLPGDWGFYDLEKARDMEAVSRDPDLFLRLNSENVIIDEAQMLPALFPALRVAIDENRMRKGRFVITGSSSPDLLSSISESLAGRVGIIEMSPLSYSESLGILRPVFPQLLDSRVNAEAVRNELRPAGSTPKILKFWFCGGYPEPWVEDSHQFRRHWMEQYISTYIYRDISFLFPKLNKNRFQLFISQLAGLSGTIVNLSDLSRALEISQPTAREYLRIADGTFVWRTVPAFSKNSLRSLIRHPKGHLRDSGLLHHLLRIAAPEDLLAHPILGHSWEGFVVEEISKMLQAEAVPFSMYHYRTRGGGEIDLIIETDYGLIPIEIKYAGRVHPRRLTCIRDFIGHHGSPFGIVVDNGERIEMLDDNLLLVPFTHLCG